MQESQLNDVKECESCVNRRVLKFYFTIYEPFKCLAMELRDFLYRFKVCKSLL